MLNIILKQRNIVRYIKAQRLAWLGYLERKHEERSAKKITRWKSSPRPKGRTKKKWEEVVLQDLQIMKLESWKTFVRRKEQLKEIVQLAKTHLGLLQKKKNTKYSGLRINLKSQYLKLFIS
jgi:DNA phosphorothioation-dependent restriction protein DptG